MAYSDTLRAATATMEIAAGLIDGILTAYGQSIGTSLINTTSTSNVDYTGASLTYVAPANRAVLIYGSIVLSQSGSSNRVTLQISKDGVDQSSFADWMSPPSRTDVNGRDGTISIFYIDTPSAGSHTYKLRWRVAAGTGYSGGYQMGILGLQNT